MKSYSNSQTTCEETSPRGLYLNNAVDNLSLIVGQVKTGDVVNFTEEMSGNNGDTEKFHASKESVWLCTLRLTLNLLSHILISLVVLICLWFSCRSDKLSVIELHIVLCVLGYHFFMSQGILLLSKFNGWSMYLKLRHRRRLHWFTEVIGAILIVAGSIEVIKDKRVNFNTLHGILGLCALITTLISILNGMVTSFVIKIGCCVNLTTATKWMHGVTGIATLFLSAGSLHYGFNKGSFKRWIDSENFIIVLKIFTWIFTVFVSFEFWIIMGKRIHYRTVKYNAQVK